MRSTSEDGKKTTFKITGLDAEDADGNELTYYVVETKVDGYNEPGYALDIGGTVTIKPDNDPTKNMAVNGNYIINTPEGGYELPQTGGIGMILFTVLGGLMTAAAQPPVLSQSLIAMNRVKTKLSGVRPRLM